MKAGSVAQALRRLANKRVPVRLEVENTEASFYTVLSLRPQGVVLGRPPDLENGLVKSGGFVRFQLPDGSKKAVRMQVVKPAVRRKRGDTVILCAMPGGFAQRSKRGSDRFNTSRYKNLSINIPQIAADFRIVDISRTGCKVLAGSLKGHDWDEFRLGRPVRFGRIEVGSKAVLELGMLIPRYINPPVVSFEWEVFDGDSARYLENLIRALHSAEVGRLKVPEKASLKEKIKAQAQAQA